MLRRNRKIHAKALRTPETRHLPLSPPPQRAFPATAGACDFYDRGEFAEIAALYGPMEHFQSGGKVDA
ncbi:hypothetical protein GQF03_03150 [Sneathiella chungangensis]|uniref:Uncharacterized protein n=1 Tax=Sneathiella chungangensis TaxID=1418234 RepID=A0A845MD78_9PROT|nr:DUF1177 domain-containing protein [Sneathiella chungangensis]MZR21320.1 hypothetical protein [Sneathiella chungangensis]